MAQNNSPIINFNTTELKDLKAFCKLNDLDINEFIKECFSQGYQIEKYGLLNADGVKVIEKEVIKEIRVEVPVEKVVEKIVVKEVPIEVIKEVERVITKNVPVEKIVEKVVIVEKEVIKEVENTDRVNELSQKITKLETELKKKPKTVTKKVEVEKPVEKIVIKEVYITDDEQVKELSQKLNELQNDKKELGKKITKLEKEKQKFSTKTKELTKEVREFSTKKEERESIFQKEVIQYDTQITDLIRKIDELESIPTVEIIKEVEVIKEIKTKSSPEKLKGLQKTIQKLKDQIREKDNFISQYEKIMLDLDKEFKQENAIFLASTNLSKKL